MEILTEEKITEKWNSTEPLVSISCLAYNQVDYVKQTLDGFLQQETYFPFEILIHDDCSTDGTTEVIKSYEEKYPHIIKGMYETENQYQQGKPSGSVVWNLPRSRGKYFAFCEGDDYWSDKKKLQKQISFLEKHPSYGMSYTKTKIFDQKKMKFLKTVNGRKFCKFDELFLRFNCIPTLSVVLRKDLLLKYYETIEPSNKNWLMGDLPMWFWFSHESKIKFHNKVTGVYRKLEKSASHFVDEKAKKRFDQSSYDIRKFFADYFKEDVLWKEYEKVREFEENIRLNKKKDIRESYLKLNKTSRTLKRTVNFFLTFIKM